MRKFILETTANLNIGDIYIPSGLSGNSYMFQDCSKIKRITMCCKAQENTSQKVIPAVCYLRIGSIMPHVPDDWGNYYIAGASVTTLQLDTNNQSVFELDVNLDNLKILDILDFGASIPAAVQAMTCQLSIIFELE